MGSFFVAKVPCWLDVAVKNTPLGNGHAYKVQQFLIKVTDELAI